MNIVPIIKDGGIVKSHSEYPVTNTQWKVIDYSLNGYLEGLNLKGYNDGHRWGIFDGITQSYLRIRFRNDKNMDVLVRMDPWHRVFKCFPPDNVGSNLYQYYCFRNDDVKIDVNVIVTTVNKSRVFCVDITRDI
jgi:hypothetical protein